MKEKYWKEVYQCRQYILDRMRESGLRIYEEQHMLPGIFWNLIEENGGLGLVCECNGFPTRLCTPLGEINFIKRKLSVHGYTDETRKAFMDQLTEELGLVLMDERKVYGEVHPLYAITKLPWRTEALPLMVERTFKEEELTEASRKAKAMCKKVCGVTY